MATFRENFVNFFRGKPNEYEAPPPPQARPDVPAPQHVDTTANQRYNVEKGRITRERPGRLDTRGATEPREDLTDAEKAVETQEYMQAVMRGLTEIRGKEAEIVENRYGKGMMSAFRGLNQWLHETDMGRAVKIGGKVVGGLSMAACAGMMVGTPGIAFSPALALMGKKMAISGAIEAFQYFGGMRTNPETGQREIGGKERFRRLDMEAARDMRGNLEVVAQDVRDRFDRGEISAEDYRSRCMTIVRGIQDNEESILRTDREYEDIRKSNQRVRGLASTVATMGIGLLSGVPFGIQDLDKNGIAHEVVARMDGIRWAKDTMVGPLQSLMNNFGEVKGLVAGVGSNAANIAGSMDQFWQLSGGLGIAAAGMAAQTFREFGTLAQGSRARIRELLGENVRIEDGVIPRPQGRPTTTLERGGRATTAMDRGPARPTSTTEQRRTTTIERGTTTMEQPTPTRTEVRPTTAINRATTTMERPAAMGTEVRPTSTTERRRTTTIDRGTTTAANRATTTMERPVTARAEVRPTTAIDRATTTAEGQPTQIPTEVRPTSTLESGKQLGTLRGNLKIESFFENGNTLFKKDLLRALQGASPDAQIDASAMAVGQWLDSLDAKELKRLDSYLSRQQKAAEKNKGNYDGENGREDLYKKNLKSLQALRDQIVAAEQRKQ